MFHTSSDTEQGTMCARLSHHCRLPGTNLSIVGDSMNLSCDDDPISCLDRLGHFFYDLNFLLRCFYLF